MSTFIDIDSQFREFPRFRNPADFQVTAEQVETWFQFNRTVRANAKNPATAPLDFAQTVRLKSLIIPYVVNGGLSIDFSILPRVYVDFHSEKFPDIRLMHSIDGLQSEAKFVCSFDKYQVDDASNRVWIHYKCDMEQVMRFQRREPVNFKVMSRNGTALPLNLVDTGASPDPSLQVMATFEITPYLLDSSFDNHLSSPHTTI